MNNNQLVIAAPIVNAVVPKPTKAEIVEALATKKHAQLLKERAEAQAKANALEAEAKTAMLDYVAKNIHSLSFDVDIGSLERRDWSDKESPRVLRRTSCSADLLNLPAEVASKCRAAIKAREAVKYVPDILCIRRDIRDSLTGTLTKRSDRVAALLSDEKSSAALDKLLRAMDRSEKVEDAAAVAV